MPEKLVDAIPFYIMIIIFSVLIGNLIYEVITTKIHLGKEDEKR